MNGVSTQCVLVTRIKRLKKDHRGLLSLAASAPELHLPHCTDLFSVPLDCEHWQRNMGLPLSCPQSPAEPGVYAGMCWLRQHLEQKSSN